MENIATRSGRSILLKWLLASGALIAAGVAAFLFFAPRDADAMKDKTVHALRIRDVDALCALADAEELQNLHLTPAVVKEWLKDTLPGKNLDKAQVVLFRKQPADQRGYSISWPDDAHTDLPLTLSMIEDHKSGWHLDLSDFLWSCCFRHSGSPGGIEEYVTLAKKYGVTGKLSPAGGAYVPLDELERAIPVDKKL